MDWNAAMRIPLTKKTFWTFRFQILEAFKTMGAILSWYTPEFVYQLIKFDFSKSRFEGNRLAMAIFTAVVIAEFYNIFEVYV